jgi:general stress protein YciG
MNPEVTKFLKKIGKRGGKKTREKGLDHYRELGRKSGEARRKLAVDKSIDR